MYGCVYWEYYSQFLQHYLVHSRNTPINSSRNYRNTRLFYGPNCTDTSPYSNPSFWCFFERGRRQNIDTALKIADVDAPPQVWSTILLRKNIWVFTKLLFSILFSCFSRIALCLYVFYYFHYTPLQHYQEKNWRRFWSIT